MSQACMSPASLSSGADLAFLLWSTCQTVQLRPRTWGRRKEWFQRIQCERERKRPPSFHQHLLCYSQLFFLSSSIYHLSSVDQFNADSLTAPNYTTKSYSVLYMVITVSLSLLVFIPQDLKTWSCPLGVNRSACTLPSPEATPTHVLLWMERSVLWSSVSHPHLLKRYH